jgi:hypothetical protein
MTIEAKRAARRAAMPIVTAIVQEYEQFAPKVIFAHENGVTVGKPPQYIEVFEIPARYFPMAQIEAKGRKC